MNSDRISGYQKAIGLLPREDEHDLKKQFNSKILESYHYMNELVDLVHKMGGNVVLGGTISGKFYRAWMDFNSLFDGGNRDTILKNCIYGEEAAKRAYEMALVDHEVTVEVKKLILRQKNELKDSLKTFHELKSVIYII